MNFKLIVTLEIERVLLEHKLKVADKYIANKFWIYVPLEIFPVHEFFDLFAEPWFSSLFAEVARLNSVEYVPGGCALNTLRVARWMLGDSSDDGVRVNFAGLSTL